MIISSFAGIAAGPGMSEVYAIAAVVDISNNEILCLVALQVVAV